MLKSKDGASTLDLANVDGATALMIASKAITGKPFISKLLDMGANPNLAGVTSHCDLLCQYLCHDLSPSQISRFVPLMLILSILC